MVNTYNIAYSSLLYVVQQKINIKLEMKFILKKINNKMLCICLYNFYILVINL